MSYRGAPAGSKPSHRFRHQSALGGHRRTPGSGSLSSGGRLRSRRDNRRHHRCQPRHRSRSRAWPRGQRCPCRAVGPEYRQRRNGSRGDREHEPWRLSRGDGARPMRPGRRWSLRRCPRFSAWRSPPAHQNASALDRRLKAAEATSDRLFGRAHACVGPRCSGRRGAVLSHETADRLERLVRGSAAVQT